MSTTRIAKLPMTLALVPAFAFATSSSTIFAEEYDYFELGSATFNNSTTIDNEWWPLNPGTQHIYEGTTIEGDEETPHRIVFTVTDLTKVINGVKTVVVYDSDFIEDQVSELELAFFAQDDDGNVWHLGQYYELYEDDEYLGGRMWAVGLLEGAKAGMMMKANPELGQPSYSQGYAPAPFKWWDRARLAETGVSTQTKSGNYDDVIITEEFNEDEPDAIQLKYYARGVGNVRIGWAGDDEQQETMELVEVVQLDDAALADFRTRALQLEYRANMYGKTPPAEQRM